MTKTNEQWITLEEDNRYQISNLGRVKRVAYTATWEITDRWGHKKVFHRDCPEKIINQFLTGGSNGKYTNGKGKYLLVQLGVGGKLVYVHRLVAKYFIPNPNNLPCVNHINEDRKDNRVENLEWCTHQENSQHSAYKWTGIQTTHSEEFHKEHDPYQNHKAKNKRIADGYCNKIETDRWALKHYKDYLSKDEKKFLQNNILENIQHKKYYNGLARISFEEFSKKGSVNEQF